MRVLDPERSSISVRVAPTAQVGAAVVAMTFRAGELAGDGAGAGWVDVRVEQVDLSPVLMANLGPQGNQQVATLAVGRVVRLTWATPFRADHPTAGNPPIRRTEINPAERALVNLLPVTLTAQQPEEPGTGAAATTVAAAPDGSVSGRMILDPRLFGITAPAFLNVLVHVGWRVRWTELT